MIRLKSLLTEDVESYKTNGNWNYAKIESSTNASDIAALIKQSKGTFNDDEAVAEAAFMAMAKTNIYDKVKSALGQDPYAFVDSFITTSTSYHKQAIDTSYKKIQALKTTTKSKSKSDAVSTVNKKSIDSVLAATGYAATSGAYVLAKVIATKEGWLPDANNGKGSRAYRNNNPGNLDYQESFKTIDPKVRKESGANGRFAVFSFPELGAKALIQKKILRWANGSMPATSANQTLKPKYVTGDKPTIKQFITTYAPPSENNTSGYIAKVVAGVKSIKPNTTANTLVASIIS